MTSAFYRSLPNKYSQHTQWFPLSNETLWTLISASGVCSSDWKTSYTPMQVLEFMVQSRDVEWNDMHNYCMVGFFAFMRYCLVHRFIVPRPLNTDGTSVSVPSIRLHMSWCTIFFKVYDV